MPGLRRQPGISSYTNSLYHADMHTQSWDRSDQQQQQQHSIVSQQRRPVSNAHRLKQGREKHNYLGTTTTKPVVTVPIRYGSTESDDLQAMVHDFYENEEAMDGTDSDTPAPAKKLIDTLQALTTPGSALERDLLKEVKLQLLSINDDSDLVCDPEGVNCKGGCVKRFVVNHLKVTGYDAAVCKCKWLSSGSSGRVPGGEYEYIDVVCNGIRLIVDVDFKAQFEIARPTQQYEAALKIVPAVFVGPTSKLEQVLQFMSEAAKASLKQSDMHLPPWRTLDYMSSKWLSAYERKKTDSVPVSPAKRPRSYHHWQEKKNQSSNNNNNNNNRFIINMQCGEQLRHTKLSLIAEMKSSEAVSHLSRSRAASLLPLRG